MSRGGVTPSIDSVVSGSQIHGESLVSAKFHYRAERYHSKFNHVNAIPSAARAFRLSPIIPAAPPPSFVCCEGPTKGSNCGASGRGASAVIGRTGLSALVAPGESRTPLPPSGRSEQIQGSWTRICKWGGRRRNDTGRGGRHGSGGWNRRR